MYLTVVPAYGRDYKSKKEVLADWNANKDFQICSIDSRDGKYVNKDHFPVNKKATHVDLASVVAVNVRYAALRKVCVIPVQ